MTVIREGIKTGLFVLLSLAVLTSALIYLGAPGVFTKQKQFSIFFDNAAGIKLGTPVMLAGRKIGQVVDIFSPVPANERPLSPDGAPLPLEVRVEVKVDHTAQIFRVTKFSPRLGDSWLKRIPLLANNPKVRR